MIQFATKSATIQPAIMTMELAKLADLMSATICQHMSTDDATTNAKTGNATGTTTIANALQDAPMKRITTEIAITLVTLPTANGTTEIALNALLDAL